ncbi:MAG TPA: glycoside hydrolase family 44 protein [Anaerolineales bacterium]|nr:glycoside hydrolase family 44 protein [Anaerolineales bacterium]
MKTRSTFLIILVLCLAAVLASLSVTTRSVLAVANSPIYTDALDPAWQDWSYNSLTTNYANTSPVHTGTDSIAVTYTGGWSGLQVGYHGANLDISAYDTLRFWINGGSAGGQTVQLQFGGLTQNITPLANTWTEVDFSLLPLGTPRTAYNIQWFNNTAGSQPTFYLDDIAFVDSGNPTPTPLPPVSGPNLSVDASANRHAISPYIYGMNFASEDIANAVRLPVRRWGGNSTSRYNYQNNFSNTGSDWYFENILQDTSAADFIAQNLRTSTQTLLTVPLIGWVSKDSPSDHPFNCGFKVSKYGAQQDTDPYDSDCGNGVHTDGTNITGNDPTDTSLAITPAFVTGWVNSLVSSYGTAANGGVMFYDLDNEPMLWDSTHRDVHPNPTTYDEMLTKTTSYAAALKAADPSAKTLGPVVWGWCAYFYSALDGCNPGTDRAAHGNMDFIPWYLQQMAAYEQQHNLRILDYLDVHDYPQADGVSSDSLGSTDVQAARLRSTRELWDPTYVDESWIDAPVDLIPRMKTWVANNYPGTGLAISEYNWGALDYMNGALAQADLLGIFGREGLDLAALWGPPTDVSAPGVFAFRMYRNYDGAGAGFGETSLQASSTDQDSLAVYAAQRSSDGALTLMLVNKTGRDQSSPISLANFQPAGTAQVYRYSSANLAAIVRQTDLSIPSATFTAVYPANSITLLVIPPASTGPYPVFLPQILR